jgi:transcriptional regulator
MHIPPQFRNSDIKEVKSFIEANSFALLVSTVKGKPWATHIPIELHYQDDGSFILEGHVSKGNPQWKNFNLNEQVMAVFSGPHAYISSSWYDHVNVPTWNYIAVHVYGTIKILEGEAVIPHLKRLVNKYESGSSKPVSVESMPSDFLARELKGLVGFEIKVEEVVAAYKLSQNRDQVNHQSIVHQLEKRAKGDDLKIAKQMKIKGHK